MATICGDNRFEIVGKAKEALLESTNIEESPKEMAVLDDFLFRCWQMGWLDKYETEYSKDYFTGMKHLADAILYELERLADYYNERSRTYKWQEYYSGLEEGVNNAIDVVEKMLYMQLEVKGEEEK